MKTSYLLACLSEEAGEVIQIIGKCHRFGIKNHHPNEPKCNTNINALQREFNDFLAVAELLGLDRDQSMVDAKKAKIKEWL